MAVYSIGTKGKKHMTLQVTRRFKVFDTVEITLRDDKSINGEIVYIGADELHITGPYVPIEVIKFREIMDVIPWKAPEDWK